MQKFQNDLFLRVANGEKTERPPVWMMRQAGRVLPQYRAVRETLSGFKELVTSPEFACEVTIQPVDEWDVDAAIIFSDILVIPEAMGLDYEMEEKKGPFFPRTIQTSADIQALISGIDAASKLTYVYDAIKLTSDTLNGRVPLIGFCGAPWTLLAYMVEGGGSKTFSKAKKFLYTQPELAHQLLDKIADSCIEYLKLQIAAGASLVQIFDSWAGVLTPELYYEFSLKYIRKICAGVTEAPITVFAKDAWFALPLIAGSGNAVTGLDWTIRPDYARTVVGYEAVLQGNLDPCVLYANPDVIRRETTEMLKGFGQHHIANLGHGLYPDIPKDNVRVFVDTVKSFRYDI